MLMMILAPWWRTRQGWLLVPLFLLMACLWRAGVFQGIENPSASFSPRRFPVPWTSLLSVCWPRGAVTIVGST